MSTLFIGVDGGGTKCKVRIEDENGQLLSHAMSGPANIRLSVESAWKAIHEGIEEALKPLSLSLHDKHHRFFACLGLAGAEVASAKKAFLETNQYLSELTVTTDAHIACLGAHLGQDGAIIIAGTGIVGYQVEGEHITKVSGWGFPHDDEGSGAWLGLEAVKLTFQWLDHRVEKSPLVEDIYQYFNSDFDYLLKWANEEATSSDFARLAPIVINHAQQEEVAAVRLLKKAAHEIERVAHALMKAQKNSLPLCFMGGIAPFIEPLLHEDLRATLVHRKEEPSAGAILHVRQLLSVNA